MNGRLGLARLDWFKVCLVIWGGLLAALAVYAFLYPRAHTVYDIYAPAARKWWAGQDMYALDVEYYRYSPICAVLLSPLAFLPDSWGGMLWKTLNTLVYLAGLLAWARQVVPKTLDRQRIAAVLLLALPVSLHSLYIGQANLLMVGALLLGLAAIERGAWNRAAAWLAVATLIKGYPLALGLLLCVLYPKRLPLRLAAALALGLVLPFAFQWPDTVMFQYERWIAHLGDSTVQMRERLRSFDHLMLLLGRPISAETFARLGVASGVFVLAMCLVQRWRSANLREQLTRTYLLFSVWAVLFGPATETCTYVVLAPSLAWAIVDATGVRRIFLIGLLLMAEPLVTDLFGSAVRNFANTHGCQPIGALLFAGYLLMETWKRYPAVVTSKVGQDRSVPLAA